MLPTPGSHSGSAAHRRDQTLPFFDFGLLDLTVTPGTTLASGRQRRRKSTLLRTLLGLVLPDAGTVEVLGLPMPDRQRENQGGDRLRLLTRDRERSAFRRRRSSGSATGGAPAGGFSVTGL